MKILHGQENHRGSWYWISFEVCSTQAFRKYHLPRRYTRSYLWAWGVGQTSFFIPTKTFYQALKICCIPTWSLPNPKNIDRESNREWPVGRSMQNLPCQWVIQDGTLSFGFLLTPRDISFSSFVEKSMEYELLVILPRLCKGLLDGKMDTLSKFLVAMRQVPVRKPLT